MVHSKRLRNFNMHHLDTKATVEEFLMLVRSWGDDSLLGLTHRAMIVFLVDLFGESLLKFKFQVLNLARFNEHIQLCRIFVSSFR
ncbi:hypothetical protein HanXRQr2_Chr14g0666481 [Helianthus annuus]|uniref:Uncharacterized protein n=1 Tax=Helianthus annuus TaxID=4232 RepID=A0A9K3H7Z5_HELAN|nr:hypothetical protein HanXRQr2_Chr14g0666481 [Helianthus annuus]KAJ0842254.1 hypothetical protein HanPSC8_Chr14g0639581 [Helianthus annuus]